VSSSTTAVPTGSATLEVAVQGAEGYELQDSEITAWLRGLVRELDPSADSVGVRFVDDAAMRQMNRRYRDREATTDVLTFPGETTPEGRHLGDILISVPAASRQAASAAHSTDLEIRLLLLHGVLHCMGMDHEHDDGEMARLESGLRERWVR